jgi:acyl-CoA synthetase (NDP forming)
MNKLTKEMDYLFNPRSVALVGASNTMNKWGGFTFSSIIIGGFKGKIYPVNLSETSVQGLKAYKHMRDIPDDIDLAVSAIPAPAIPSVMEECVEKGVKSAIIISAGLRETGKAGEELENEIVEIARRGNIRIVGPNCMGIYSSSSSLSVTMNPMQGGGELACVSQSGYVGGSILMWAAELGLRFSKYVSCGNCADLQIEDYIEYFGQDESIKIILAYIEGTKDGKRFVDRVSKVSKIKPVITMKCGRTNAGAKAAKSHSGSLAGTDILHDVAFKKAGVLRVHKVEGLLDTTIAFLSQPLPKNNNVSILASGEGIGSIAHYACEKNNLNVMSLNISEADMLENRLGNEDVNAVLTASVKLDEDLVKTATRLREKYEKPIFISAPTNDHYFDGEFIYPTPERASLALSKMVEYSLNSLQSPPYDKESRSFATDS